MTSENCTPIFEPQMMPATRATRPATHHDHPGLLERMPTDKAVWWSSATARAKRAPMAVFWKNRSSAATSTAAISAAAMMSSWLNAAPSKRPEHDHGSLGMPTSIEVDLAAEEGLPQAPSTQAMPSVAISSVAPWLTSLRSTKRSTAQATTNITARGADDADHWRRGWSPPSAAFDHGEARHRQRGDQHHRAPGRS